MQIQPRRDDEQIILERARFSFFSDALVLKTLCETDSLNALDNIRQTLGIQRRSGSKYYELFNGYKLVVATALYCLLDEVINNPSLLGLNDDQRLWEWWSFSHAREGISSRSPFSSPESDLANVAVLFNDLLTRIKRANKWDSLLEVAGQAHLLGETLYDFGKHSNISCISWFTGQDEHLETQEALRRGAIERVDDYLQDRKTSLTYKFVWRGEEDRHYSLSGVQLEDLSEIESYLDDPPLLTHLRQTAAKWYKGVKAGICVLLNRLRPSNREWPNATLLFGDFIEPNDQLKEFLTSELKGKYPSREYGLTPVPGISMRSLLTPTVSVPVVQPEDRLRALIGGDTTRLASNGPIDAPDFKIFLRGIVPYLAENAFIEVVRVRHPNSDPDELTWYSLALRTPKFGLFSNFSKWWAFYKVYGIGWINMTDTEVRIAERIVQETLKEFGDKIKLTELEGIPSRAFLDLFEPPAWTMLFNGVKDLLDRNSDLMGVLPELLAAALLAKRGYSNIRTSFKPITLDGERELDALGVKAAPKGGECLVIETKGRSISEGELKEEVSYFASKVKMLKEHLPELAKEIGYEGELNSISGIFVSMAPLSQFDHGEQDVTFWDFDNFIAELRTESFPRRFLDLLEQSPILREFSTDWFDANDWDEDLYETHDGST